MSIDGTQHTVQLNPPGQSALAYRVRTYASSLQKMKNHIAALRNQDESIGRLNLYADQSWALGLLESWAMTMDILSFYQERIANEGYLRTATEQYSVQELVRTLGYEPQPGVAASTYLAFTVREIPGTPSRSCPIPRGTAVQSIPTATSAGRAVEQQPGPAQLPQTFETETDFVARTEWNVLKPASTAFEGQHSLSCHVTSLRLAGTSTGLRPGDAILLIGADSANGTAPDHEPAWLFATITGVVTNRNRNFTCVTWEEGQTNCAANTLLCNPQIFALRQKATLHCSSRGGLYYSLLAPVPSWSPASGGLPATAIHALAVKTGALFAATDSGVFRSSNEGESWEMTRVGLMNTKVSALAVGKDGRLYAGTTTGNVFCSGDNGESWRLLVSKPGQRITLLGLAIPGQSISVMSLPKSAIHKIITFIRHRRLHIAVAMDDGVFVSMDQGKSWRKAKSGQNKAQSGQVAARSLLQGSHPGKIFVGMDTGIFHLKMPHALPQWWKSTLKWTAVILVLLALLEVVGQTSLNATSKKIPLLGTFLFPFIIANFVLVFPAFLVLLFLLLLLGGWWLIEQRLHTRAVLARGAVRAMALLDDGKLFAATNQGFFRSSRHGSHWETVAQEPSAPHACDVRVLQADSQQNLFAGMKDGNIFRSQDGGAHWENYTLTTSLADIQDLALQDGGIFAAGSPLNSDLDGQWSRFQSRNKLLYLDKVYSTLETGSWLVLRQAARAFLYKVTGISAAPNGDFKRNNRVTTVCVDRAEGLETFDRRQVTLFTRNEALTLFNDEPIDGDALLLNGFVPGLAPGHLLILNGKRARLRILAENTTDWKLVSANMLRSVPFVERDTYTLMAAPTFTNSDTCTLWLKDKNGFVGQLRIEKEAILAYEPASDNDEAAAEVLRILDVTSKGSNTLITLDHPLQNAYDRSTTSIYANVVYATHGQTVNQEVLGNSSPVKGKQLQFTLKQKPLTYVPASTPDGVQSTLTVYMNQMRWYEAASIQDLDHIRRAYLLRQNSQGYTQIVFDGGNHASPLPGTGEQVTATYRVGLGEAGNVPANSLTMLRSRPTGIQKVSNPLAASGGVEPEAPAQMRERAPLQTSTMQRIISLHDYEQFARVFGGISKVQALALWNGHTRLIYMTLAGNAGVPIPPESELYNDLRTAIEAASAFPLRNVHIDSFEPVYFHVQAHLIIDPDWTDQAEELVANARQSLGTAFGFAQRELGQSVSAAEILAFLQQIPGILAVELEQLYIRDENQLPGYNALLSAQSGRLEAGKLLPAQLLQINATSNDGIILKAEVN